MINYQLFTLTSKFLIFLLFLTLSISVNASQKKELREHQDTKKKHSQEYRVCVMSNQAPFSSSKKDFFTGLSFDIWNEISDELHITSNYIPINTTFDKAVDYVFNSKCDILIGPISVTHDRLKLVDFTRPYFVNKVGIMINGQSIYQKIIYSFFNNSTLWVVIIYILLLLIFSIPLYLYSRSEKKWITSILELIWILFNISITFSNVPSVKSLKGKSIVIFKVNLYFKAIFSIWLILSRILYCTFFAIYTSLLTTSIIKSNNMDSISIDDIKNHRWAVEEGSALIDFIDNNGGKSIKISNFKEGIDLLKNHQVFGVIGDYYSLDYNLKKLSVNNIVMSKNILKFDEYAFVINKRNEEILEKINLMLTKKQDQYNWELTCKKYIHNISYGCSL